jgi:RNA polymerase sigma-70 factor (ECF subfamily)
VVTSKEERIIFCLNDIALNDSSDSFRELYDNYYNRLFRQALYYLNNDHNHAREVVSDVFVALWQGRKALDKVTNPDSYIFIALKHAAARYVEQNYRQSKELLTENLPDENCANSNEADFDLLDVELQQKYKAALDNLPPRCAAVFKLVREERKKYGEVADLLGISVTTVDAQMTKATGLLYRQLKEYLFLF